MKCQPGKSTRSTHKPWPRRKGLLSNMEEIHGWMVKKESVRIAGTEFYVISYAGLVFGNNIVQYLIRIQLWKKFKSEWIRIKPK